MSFIIGKLYGSMLFEVAEFNLVTNFDKYFYNVCHCIQHLCSNIVVKGFIYHVGLLFASSGGEERLQGVCLMSASHFFPSPVHLCYLFILFILAFFYLCFLCCVVLYKWLEAELHGKSSDTADKTSGKEGLRTKQSPGPLLSLCFRSSNSP